MVRNNGIRKEFQKLDVAVWEWASNEKKTFGSYPQKKQIQSFAVQTYSNAGLSSFKASAGWYHRWRKRYNLNRANCSSVDLKIYPGETSTVGKSDQQIITVTTSGDPENNHEDNCIPQLPPCKITGSSKLQPLGLKLSKKWCAYDRDFKNEVIRYSSTRSIVKTAEEYKVHPNTVSIWLKDDQFQQRLMGETQQKSDMKFGENCSNEIVEAEKEFINWLRENEGNRKVVSESEVAEKISCLFKSSWSRSSHWFAKYCHRCIHGKRSPYIKIHYPEEFQKLLLNYACKTSQLKTASVFSIARKQLFNWTKTNESDNEKAGCERKNNAKLTQWFNSQELKPAGRVIREKAREIFHGVSKSRFSFSWYYKWCAKHKILVNQKFDEKIIEWILFAYDQNQNVSHHDVRRTALDIYRKQCAGSFKASSGWLLQFCRRYMDLIRRIPPLSISLPSSFEHEILIFRKKVSQIISENGIQRESFGVMDEIPLKLKPSGPINENYERKPLLRSCDLKNAQGSIILCCLASGVILPPVITLKDKSANTSSAEYHVLYRSGDVLDEDIILYWLDNVWFRRVKPPNFLLLDSFALHSSEKIKNKFILHNSFLEMIPGGCSSKLNPLTQIISSQLQDAIDALCKRWYLDNRLSGLGCNISLSSSDILDWVVKAFDHVNTTCKMHMIRNVFEEMRLL